MEAFDVVLLIVIAMAIFAGLSALLFLSLPNSLLDKAAIHGRYAGLEKRDQAGLAASGRAPKAWTLATDCQSSNE